MQINCRVSREAGTQQHVRGSRYKELQPVNVNTSCQFPDWDLQKNPCGNRNKNMFIWFKINFTLLVSRQIMFIIQPALKFLGIFLFTASVPSQLLKLYVCYQPFRNACLIFLWILIFAMRLQRKTIRSQPASRFDQIEAVPLFSVSAPLSRDSTNSTGRLDASR